MKFVMGNKLSTTLVHFYEQNGSERKEYVHPKWQNEASVGQRLADIPSYIGWVY